ncbi:putative HET-domain-containing protein [Seiridium cardinale]
MRHVYIRRKDQQGTWPSLSYCWGGDSAFILMSQTRAEFEAGVSLNDFPATLRDAIVVTRALGIRYIWIDASCILQDSLEHWLSEAPQKGQIYTNAGPRKVPQSVQIPWKIPIVPTSGPARSDDTDDYVSLHSQIDDTQEPVERNKATRWTTRGWNIAGGCFGNTHTLLYQMSEPVGLYFEEYGRVRRGFNANVCVFLVARVHIAIRDADGRISEHWTALAQNRDGPETS